MLPQPDRLPLPTPDLVTFYVEKYDREQAVVEHALAKLLHSFPCNTALEEVLLKVVALNGLYGTYIFATYRVAEHITQLKIDPLLQEGMTELTNPTV